MGLRVDCLFRFTQMGVNPAISVICPELYGYVSSFSMVVRHFHDKISVEQRFYWNCGNLHIPLKNHPRFLMYVNQKGSVY